MLLRNDKSIEILGKNLKYIKTPDLTKKRSQQFSNRGQKLTNFGWLIFFAQVKSRGNYKKPNGLIEYELSRKNR